jgi:murein DD-endopeptidase MepM/ murein hydrolase activator NlpD
VAAHRAARRFPLLHLLGAVAVVTSVVIPTVAVTTTEAGAHSSNPASVGPDVDDLDLFRVARNDARAEADRLALAAATAVPTAAEQQRASRDLVRKVLTNPTYVRPVPGPVTQWYGSHPGIDIAPPYGTPIVAAHAGVVTFVGWEDGYGMHVEVAQADGYATTYSHMSGWTVTVGELVKAGEQLGMVGSTGNSTGPHLHFEVHVPGGARMDPAVWLREHGVAI